MWIKRIGQPRGLKPWQLERRSAAVIFRCGGREGLEVGKRGGFSEGLRAKLGRSWAIEESKGISQSFF